METLVVSPSQVLDEMPSGIDEQLQGEWALYSCSMLSAALSNISSLYPETKEENLRNIDKLIQIIRSSELRKYNTLFQKHFTLFLYYFFKNICDYHFFINFARQYNGLKHLVHLQMQVNRLSN